MSALSIFVKAEQAWAGGNANQAFEHYQKAIKKILKDEIVDTKLPAYGLSQMPRETPQELLGHLWQNFTGFIRDPHMTYNERNAPEAWKLLRQFRVGSTHKSHERFRTPNQKLLLKGIQIISSMTIGLVAWDNQDRATAAKRYAEALKLAKTHPAFDCLGDSQGRERPNEQLANSIKGLELYVATNVQTMKDNLAVLLGNDIFGANVTQVLDEVMETGELKGAGLRKDNVPIKLFRAEKDGSTTVVENMTLASDGCAVCGKRDIKLLRCARCKVISYCGAECQKQDWKTHKAKCVKVDAA